MAKSIRHFRIPSNGSHGLKAHLEKVHAHHRNATCLSPDILNELLDTPVGMTRQMTVNEVKKVEFFLRWY